MGYAYGDVLEFFLGSLVCTFMNDSGFAIWLKSGNRLRDPNFPLQLMSYLMTLGIYLLSHLFFIIYYYNILLPHLFSFSLYNFCNTPVSLGTSWSSGNWQSHSYWPSSFSTHGGNNIHFVSDGWASLPGAVITHTCHFHWHKRAKYVVGSHLQRTGVPLIAWRQKCPQRPLPPRAYYQLLDFLTSYDEFVPIPPLPCTFWYLP